ncbi:MAG TPA: hypothetical protein PLV25_02870, partial [Opitutales bacterium]|nr:hypothetical protein [Opitutales bacterium]
LTTLTIRMNPTVARRVHPKILKKISPKTNLRPLTTSLGSNHLAKKVKIILNSQAKTSVEIITIIPHKILPGRRQPPP